MTDQQRKFYWAAVIPAACEGLARQRGVFISSEWMHEEFKLMFLPAFDHRTGEVTGDSRSTGDLTVRESAEYLDSIGRYLHERGIRMPEPNDRMPIRRRTQEYQVERVGGAE